MLKCAKGDTVFPGQDSLDHRGETRSGMGIDIGCGSLHRSSEEFSRAASFKTGERLNSVVDSM